MGNGINGNDNRVEGAYQMDEKWEMRNINERKQCEMEERNWP